MRLWTIQHAPAWDDLQRKGVLRADGRRADYLLRKSYRWLMGEMRTRIPSYSGRFPVWAWAQPKPDLRRSCHLPSGAEGVRIEFEVPADRVILSDFDAWHHVLSGDLVPLSGIESNAWHAEWEEWTAQEKNQFSRAERRERPTFYDVHRDRIRASWPRIFDLDAMACLMRDPDWGCGPDHTQFVQAVLEEIYLDEVIRVTPFVAR